MASRRSRGRRRRHDHLAELRPEEGWSSWTASRYRQMSRPTSYTWSGLGGIMRAAAWVAVWVVGIALVVGLVAFVVEALLN